MKNRSLYELIYFFKFLSKTTNKEIKKSFFLFLRSLEGFDLSRLYLVKLLTACVHLRHFIAECIKLDILVLRFLRKYGNYIAK